MSAKFLAIEWPLCGKKKEYIDLKHIQGMLLNKIEIKVQNTVYGMLNTKNREENIWKYILEHA